VPSPDEFIEEFDDDLETKKPNFKKKFVLSNSKYANLGATEYKPRTTITYAAISPTSATKIVRSQSSLNWLPMSQTHTYKIPQRNSIYNVESRAKKLNDLILLTYVKSNYQKNNLLNQVLHDYLTNLTKLRIDDNISSSRSSSKELLFDSFKQFSSTNAADLLPTSFKPKANGLGSPCEDAPDGALIRDANDCSSFYTCFMGKEIKKSTCEKGLVFDMTIKVCNWESQVTC
jgi:hypothetical protein